MIEAAGPQDRSALTAFVDAGRLVITYPVYVAPADNATGEPRLPCGRARPSEAVRPPRGGRMRATGVMLDEADYPPRLVTGNGGSKSSSLTSEEYRSASMRNVPSAEVLST